MNTMKKLMCLLLALSFFISVSGCGQTKTIDGIEYDTYGLLNENEKRNPDIAYEVIWGNVFWGCLFLETIVAPVYFFGFSLFEPVGKANPQRIKGAVRSN
jgi:hypothetical protein